MKVLLDKTICLSDVGSYLKLGGHGHIVICVCVWEGGTIWPTMVAKSDLPKPRWAIANPT